MSLISDNQAQIHHESINCRSCLVYQECKSIETKHGKKLEELEGSWRAIFEDGKRVGTPIRRCSHAIVTKHVDKFNNKSVLELGCGPLSEIDYDFCKNNNVHYIGLEPERLPSKLILNKIKHNKLPNIINKIILSLYEFYNGSDFHRLNEYQRYILDYFPSEYLKAHSFDLIYGNSTIEHWHEDQEDFEKSLNLYKKDIDNIYNLLKPGGCLLINCPIHVHGNNIFIYGKIDYIERFFSNRWKTVVFEHWREYSDDLMPYCPTKRKKHYKDNYNIDLENIWVMNVVARK